MTHTLEIHSASSLLDPVIFCPSPHHDDRPQNAVIDMIVIHGISLPPGEFGANYVEAFFCGNLDINAHPAFMDIQSLRVSAHLLIKRSGEIIQFVPFAKRAWHAGQSFFKGQSGCNDFSIGIELEGTDEIPYERVQYHELCQIIKLLKTAYPAITNERIVGHADIAPNRKTDPGPVFDWDYLKGILA